MSENRPDEPGAAGQQAFPTAAWLLINREVAAHYELPPVRFSLRGAAVQSNRVAARGWAERINAGRQRFRGGGGEDGERPPAVSGPLILGAVALIQLARALLSAATAPGAAQEGAFDRSLSALPGGANGEASATLRRLLTEEFITSNGEGALSGRASARQEGRGAGAGMLEALLLLEFCRGNAALAALRELFTGPELHASAAHAAALRTLERELLTRKSAPRTAPLSLFELLFAPVAAAQASLERQLRGAVSLWEPHLAGASAELVESALRAADELAEEWRAAPPPGSNAPAVREPFGEARGTAGAPVGAGAPEGAEASSPGAGFGIEAPYMATVVMIAKSTHVWLEQLSKRHGRAIERLDQIPEEALGELAELGVNALWLVGLWRRGAASREIKRLKGQEQPLASAYSIYDYEIAPALGGEGALRELQARAERRGIRLACDMVPNHTAIDGRWVAEHPEWFVQLTEPPYPGYRFSGPNLSTDPRMEIRIEDGYYSGTDAAVVFERIDASSGEARYLYHGNDGTGLPWNDTAQLDFLNDEVRNAVIATTLEVARRFPIIRLDAAMTLAKRHVRRLWHPAPGEGGAIPSRSAHALSQAEFSRRMPREFWRDLTSRVASEAPGTMLLAEAFWLMEEFFVRELGVQRVYNGAFMHHLREEENGAYREFIKGHLASEPRVLAHFVNYMSNPDEEPAAAQFVPTEKEFGVATLLAALPGMPLFAHGQVEGLTEKYGMEFGKPRLDEEPNRWWIARYEREVAPLLKRRELFAGSDRFELFDGVAPGGEVVGSVYAFTNGGAAGKSLTLYNNSSSRVTFELRASAPRVRGGALTSRSLVAALGGVSGRPARCAAPRCG